MKVSHLIELMRKSPNADVVVEVTPRRGIARDKSASSENAAAERGLTRDQLNQLNKLREFLAGKLGEDDVRSEVLPARRLGQASSAR